MPSTHPWDSPASFKQYRRQVAAASPGRFEHVPFPGGMSMTDYANWIANKRPQVQPTHNISYQMSLRLWEMMHDDANFFSSFGNLSGGAAEQASQAGLKSQYLSGWQIAADMNERTYPDQSLYSPSAIPAAIRRMNAAYAQSEANHFSEYAGENIMVPIMADIEAGFGGNLNVYELVRACIEAGAAGVHLEDQLSSEKKCGHMGGKVVIPLGQHLQKIGAVHLARDVEGVPLVLMARTDIRDAKLMAPGDIQAVDAVHIDEARAPHNGFLWFKESQDPEANFELKFARALSRGLAFAEAGADIVWCETPTPDLQEAIRFAKEVRAKFPHQIFGYNCSPSFNLHGPNGLSREEALEFQQELWRHGYRFIFITLAGIHVQRLALWLFTQAYCRDQLGAFWDIQKIEQEQGEGFLLSTNHQRAVGSVYFDDITKLLTGSDETDSSGGTEKQFAH